MIECLGSGLIYRNPIPHVRSVQAYFPSVLVLGNGELLATLVLAEAFEAANGHAYVSRSTDQGETWNLEGPIYPGTADTLTSDACRLTVLPDGEIVALMSRCERGEHPDEGLANPENMGFVPNRFMLLRSRDNGHTFSEPQPIEPPLVGPSFELCCPITPLKDGRWILPTSTWRGWDGSCPNGMRMVAFVSHDQGQSWPEYQSVMGDPEQRLIYWESKIVELQDGRLLAVAWVYDEKSAADQPNGYALSEDGGSSWSTPFSTYLHGQTLTPFILNDGRILCLYRRLDIPGLWANLSHLEDREWINDADLSLWGSGEGGLTAHEQNMTQNFNVLRFGAPCLAPLADGTVFAAFWCYEDCVANIRWFKLKVQDRL